MNSVADPWALPGLARWLKDVVERLDHGLAILPTDPTRPPGLLEAVRSHLRLNPVAVTAAAGAAPATAFAEVLGIPPTLDELLNPVFDQDVAIVSLGGVNTEDLRAWSLFLARFAAARAAGRSGPALLVAEPPWGIDAPAQAVPAGWRLALRRGDRVIWAEEHLPPSREGLAADLAVALAVELCDWRLDLAAALVQSGIDDLAEPISWLSRRSESPIQGSGPSCPLASLAEGRVDELSRRIWKAQLTALFPALESWRLEIVTMHRSRLRIDDHLRGLGITSLDEIELGALRFQLRRSLTRPEADRLDLFSRARNALAHRQPVDPEDARHLFRA